MVENNWDVRSSSIHPLSAPYFCVDKLLLKLSSADPTEPYGLNEEINLLFSESFTPIKTKCCSVAPDLISADTV